MSDLYIDITILKLYWNITRFQIFLLKNLAGFVQIMWDLILNFFFAEIPGWISPHHVSINTHHILPVQSIPSSLSSSSQNSIHSDANNQIQYNQMTLQSEQHGHVIIDNDVHSLSPAKEDILLGSGGILPPMAIMRPPTCDKITCQHGGRCINKGRYIKCYCPLGFGGQYCERSK